MFNSITQRLLWKEFRAQQMVWIAIAGELVLLQLWWGIKGHEYADLNLFSMAFVLTGVFAMTTSALLFAGESEAKTDLFLRQLPITSRQLIAGKLLYGGLALVAFLVFALLSSLLAGQMAGKYGGDDSSMMGDPSVFALSIVGLAAWGLFYSLLTRKVLWTVIGASLTEITVGGIVHSLILADYHMPEWVFYWIYTVIIAGVVAVDIWLLSKWCTSDAHLSVDTVFEFETAPGQTTSATELPWHSAFRWSWFTGVASGFFTAVLLLFVAYIQDSSISHTPITPFLAMGTLMGLVGTGLLRWDRSRGKPVAANSGWRLGGLRDISLGRLGGIVVFGGQGLFAFLLGLVVCGSMLALLVSLIAPNVDRRGEAVAVSLFFALASGVAAWWRDDRLRSGSVGWLRPLQLIHAVRHRSVRSVGPLLWIEIRRARPVLLGGLVLLVLIGQYPARDMQDHAHWSLLAIVIAALVCGLLTILPDRSHGTLAFLTERGVSSTKVLGSKVFVWGSTLLLMLIPPLWQGRIWRMLDIPIQIPRIADRLVGQQGGPVIEWTTSPSPASYLFVLLLGTFTIGVLAAAWVRRPILAGIVGFMLMLPWFGGCMMLLENLVPIGLTAVVPIILIGLGILWTGQRTLLEQSSWRSKFGQIAWVLLAGFIGLQGVFHFRANEVPLVNGLEEFKVILNAQPSPLDQSVSSWMYTFDESIPHATQLDSLVDDESKSHALVQPPGLWGAPNSLQSGIESLKLNEEACDLAAAFEHLRKWHQLTEKLAFASRDEDGWVDALYGRRVVLSAIRKWANHPHQTAERIEAAQTQLDSNQIGVSGATVIARQYADTRRSLESANSLDSIHSKGVHSASPVTHWLLARTGERERVRRLVDYYYYLSAGSYVAQPLLAGAEFDYWIGNTRASAAALGVSLPWARFNVRHHGQFELVLSAESATRLVLRLQAWRLKHGSFPASFADVFDEFGPGYTRDPLTNEQFDYKPQGFDRDLLAEYHTLIPAQQPLLYSEGMNEPRGVELTQVDPQGKPLETLQYRSRNFYAREYRSQQSQSATPRPANPLTIRFSVFGQIVDEDSLYQPHRSVPSEEKGPEAEAAGGDGAGMSNSMMSEAPPFSPPASDVPLPQPEVPEVPEL